MSTLPHALITQLQANDLSFADFMQEALYSPEFGYYSRGFQKLGAGGDFTTAPEMSPLFAYTLANQCKQIFSTYPESRVLLEFGAGTGRLCVDLLTRLEQLDCLPAHYFILEVSADLRERQQTLVQSSIPHLAERVSWLEQWPNEPISGIMIANEVLDAMPVHRFLWQEDNLLESYIGLDKQNALVEHYKPCQNQRLINYLKPFVNTLPTPYQSEVNLFAPDWIKQCAQRLKQGAIFLIDYGFPRREYYHPDRRLGTLMCHYQQTAHPDPFIHVGSQDITAHVDFTQLAEAADDAGLHVAGFTHFAAFLIANDLLSLLNEISDPVALFRAQQAVKHYTLPSEMGELFKVMALTKNCDIPLNGFQLLDKRVSL